jgi:hypothetical protein
VSQFADGCIVPGEGSKSLVPFNRSGTYFIRHDRARIRYVGHTVLSPKVVVELNKEIGIGAGSRS